MVLADHFVQAPGTQAFGERRPAGKGVSPVRIEEVQRSLYDSLE